MKYLMALGMMFLTAGHAEAAPTPKKARNRASQRRAVPNRPARRAPSAASRSAGRASAFAAAGICPATIKCRVGDTKGVELKKVWGPATREGKLQCRYTRTPGDYASVSSSVSRCYNTDVVHNQCSGFPSIMKVSRSALTSDQGRPHNGKCRVLPTVWLKQK